METHKVLQKLTKLETKTFQHVQPIDLNARQLVQRHDISKYASSCLKSVSGVVNYLTNSRNTV